MVYLMSHGETRIKDIDVTVFYNAILPKQRIFGFKENITYNNAGMILTISIAG